MEKALPYLTTGAPQVEMMSSASFLVCLLEHTLWIQIEIIYLSLHNDKEGPPEILNEQGYF